MKKQHQTMKPSEDLLDKIAPWGLTFLSVLTAVGAVVRMVGVGEDVKISERIDNTTLLYLVVAGVLLLFRSIKTFSFGDVKLEMLEKVQERQAQQADKINDLQLIIPLLLPENEQKHLINLANNKTTKYRGNSPLRNELRRLASSRLINRKPAKMIEQIKDDLTFNLADYVELTNLGKQWAKRIEELEYQREKESPKN